MSRNNIDREKDIAENARNNLKRNEVDRIADEKAYQKKTKADTVNSLETVNANEKANIAKLKADKSEVGSERSADYRKADVIANVEKANANTKRYKTYADADAERMKTHNER